MDWVELQCKLNKYPLLSQAFCNSLKQRACKPDWYESQYIRELMDGDLTELEAFLQIVYNCKVHNWEYIFSVLDGNSIYYDFEIQEALAEVSFISWAIELGVDKLEKLNPKNKSKTPDFLLEKDNETIVAEVKHFRWRDYLPEFVENRLKGLHMIYPINIGITAEPTDTYKQMRDFLFYTRKKCEVGYRKVIRDELSTAWFKSLEGIFTDRPDEEEEEPNKEIEVFCGLFSVRRDDMTPGVEFNFWGPNKNQHDAANLMLKKLIRNINQALDQILDYIKNKKQNRPNMALIFITGTSSWSEEWKHFLDMLKSDQALKDRARTTYTEVLNKCSLRTEVIIETKTGHIRFHEAIE